MLGKEMHAVAYIVESLQLHLELRMRILGQESYERSAGSWHPRWYRGFVNLLADKRLFTPRVVSELNFSTW